MVVAQWSGSAHDSFILKHSSVRRLQTGSVCDHWLLGQWFFLSLSEKKFINDIEWLLKNLLKQEEREDQFEVECIIGNADVWINLVAFRYTGEGEQACPHFLCVKYL